MLPPPSAMSPRMIRDALTSSIEDLPEKLPKSQFLYFPLSHMRALHPDSPLVRGTRGAGKSVWWTVLLSNNCSDLLRSLFSLSHLSAVTVSPGFGEHPDVTHPDRDTLEQLLQTHHPRKIWRSVAVWQLASAQTPALETWSERVSWVSQNPEAVATLLHRSDSKLEEEGKLHIIVFDALDRTASTWDARVRLLEGLLENLLDFAGYNSIRLKAFVRTDMMISNEIGRFPDSSKVLGKAVDLSWPALDLYGLLWQYLSNAVQGAVQFREECSRLTGLDFRYLGNTDTWMAAQALNEREDLQWKLMDSIAGRWMGNDKRRGYPYTWLPNHLADAHNSASPRSFLAALKQAAIDTDARYSTNCEYALHYEAIKRGVQQASQIRVNEMHEDFPWIGKVMEPLRGLTVPVELTELASRWQAADLPDQLSCELRGVFPRRAGNFEQGLCEQLRAAGIIAWTPDGRVNLPDVYRIGFGLKRMGGVRPLRPRQ